MTRTRRRCRARGKARFAFRRFDALTAESIHPVAGLDRLVVIVIGYQLAMALANLRLRETLKNQSIRDALTGLFNRRCTDETFVREIHRAAREKSDVSLVSIDVDFFKKFNDVHGHQAGGRVLSQLGVLLRGSTRGADVASRMGGEELAILMPVACAVDAVARAEESRRAAESLAIIHDGRSIGPVTLSIGVASFRHHGAAVEDIMRAAEAALYRAKRAGRNRRRRRGSKRRLNGSEYL